MPFLLWFGFRVRVRAPTGGCGGLDAGEEVTIKLVENILVILIGVWNEHISEIHNEVQQMLEDLQQSDSDGNKEATSSNAATLAEQMLQALQPLNVSKHPKAMQNLECIK